MSETTMDARPETQKQRWLKYGANVMVVSAAVVILAGLVIYLAQRFSARVDTTTAGLYSLKPQTINIIKNNTHPIKIVSLYSRTETGGALEQRERDRIDHVQVVADLLEEYKRKGAKIDIEIIDPNEQPTKLDNLINDVVAKYSGEVRKYRALVEEYPATYDKLAAIAEEERAKVEKLSMPRVSDPMLAITVIATVGTVYNLKDELEETRSRVDRILKATKIPDYKGATNIIGEDMGDLTATMEMTIANFARFKSDENIPGEWREYMAQSAPQYEQIRKLADDLATRVRELGELKLDDLRQQLQREKQDAILVMGEHDMRVLSRNKVWRMPEDIHGYSADGKPRERFAGEQQITSAILAVTARSKPRVVFVRPGGPPLAAGGFRAGPFALIADRLRDYNFEVLEKDISGMWAMQAQMQGMPPGAEASDEQMKDAVWVVIAVPGQRSPMNTGSVAEKLAEHLAAGGSALVLCRPTGDALADALDEWGVKIRTDAIVVHEPIPAAPTDGGDPVEEWLRIPFVFSVKEYGDHALARPLRSLESLMLAVVPVEISNRPGYKATPLLPIPTNLKFWGESDIERTTSLERPEFNPAGGDIADPQYAGAIVEKEGGGRLVVIGSLDFAINQFLDIPDVRMRKQRIHVSRFPGNGELVCNSVFWLSRKEALLAISPSAMEVSRVQEIRPAALWTWRFGVLAGLPMVVVLGGIAMYLRRRD